MRNKFYTCLLLFLLPVLASVLIFSCGKDHAIDVKKYGNCSNKVQDQNETGMDCGGVCQPCASCNDGIKNQGEDGVDCGGPCVSCVPACTVASSKVNYTLYPSPTAYENTASSGASYLNNSLSSEIIINVSGSALVGMHIRFRDEFNPFDVVPMNETMVFTTVKSSFDQRSDNQVVVDYNYNFGFSGHNGGIDAGQAIHFTRTGTKKARIQFCNLKGGSTTSGTDVFEINIETF
jgi:hypothetical protein